MLVANLPAKFTYPFGKNASGTDIRAIPVTTVDPNAASQSLGFPPNTFNQLTSGGAAPDGRDVNGILNQATSWDQWYSAGGPIIFDSTFSAAVGGYPKGAQVASATSFGTYWLSTVDGNTTDPDAGGAGWVGISPVNRYAQDTGSANAVVCTMAPPLLQHVVGLPIYVKIAVSNNGPSTFNPGPGIKNVARRNGTPLMGNELVAGNITKFAYDGTRYLVDGIAPASQAAIDAVDTQSAVTPAMFPFTTLSTTSAWARMPNGLLFQWQVAGGSPGGTLNTFLIPFPTGCLSIMATAQNSGTAVVGADIVSPTQFTVFNNPGSLGGPTFIQSIGH